MNAISAKYKGQPGRHTAHIDDERQCLTASLQHLLCGRVYRTRQRRMHFCSFSCNCYVCAVARGPAYSVMQEGRLSIRDTTS